MLLPDLQAGLDLAPAAVAALCDRRRGLGADGVLRVTTAGAALAAGVLDRLPDGVGAHDWYMDYRNADGSVAQMCGNGVRVFAHYLRVSGLERRDEFVVGSPAGPRPVVVHRADDVSADVTVEMGKVNRLGVGPAVVGGRRFTGLGVDVGNPHLACVDPDLTDAELAALDVGAPVEFDHDQFPEGVNIEVVTAPRADGAITMRVHERASARPAPAAPERWRRPPPRWRTAVNRPARCGSGSRAGRSASRSATPPAFCGACGAGGARRARRRVVGGATLRATAGTIIRCAALSGRDTISTAYD